ncbi:ribonuclease H family protein [Candidatus Giovannonibacteria bacterium]|nr:ribonuclease H family protein [Candidatus Giovannonibacteria bacterium]
MASNKRKYYAYFIPGTKIKGVAETWEECKAIVSGVEGAKYKGFSTKEEAERWLNAGADYNVKHLAAVKGVYFDAGTGGGMGVEVSVTDENGNDLLHNVLAKNLISKRGKHLLPHGFTNNYGELLACKYALQIAGQLGTKKIFGDSRLVLEYWSKGRIKREGNDSKAIQLSLEVAKLRNDFEKKGGKIEYISGDDNPADLGFHK